MIFTSEQLRKIHAQQTKRWFAENKGKFKRFDNPMADANDKSKNLPSCALKLVYSQ